MKKVVLGFSGGLDTTFCVKYLSEEKGFGLDSSSVKVEQFPLVLHPPENIEMKRIENHSH